MNQTTQEQGELSRLPNKEMAYLMAHPDEFPNISRDDVLAESSKRLEAEDTELLADRAAAISLNRDTHLLLQKLWTEAVGTPTYDKRQWLELERLIGYGA